jgi:Transglycosylase SLT domain
MTTTNTAKRLLTARKTGITGIATAGAAACALSLIPHQAHAADTHTPHTTTGAAAAAAAAAGQADTGGKKSDKGEPSVKGRQAAKVAAIVKDSDHKYADNLHGWIKQSLAIMKVKHIPGSYDGLHRNIIRESAGDPDAVNDWDVNAQKGIPSKGLLQVIQPTFDTYHVKGTKDRLTDPVANIVAAANYAADRYGSMDNVNSAY